MPVQNIECQIAQSQIGRYLHGDRFSPDALKQLEGHISECLVCTEILAARKKALQSLLSQAVETHSNSTEDIDASTDAILNMIRNAPDDPKMTLMDVLRHKESPSPEIKAVVNQDEIPTSSEVTSAAIPEIKAPNYRRIVVLTGMLAVVTMGMNYFAKDPSRLFGEKVGVASKISSTVTDAPSITTGGESAIPVIDSFGLEEVVPPLFAKSIFEYEDSVESRSETLKNSVDLPDLVEEAPIEEVSVPEVTTRTNVEPKISEVEPKPTTVRSVKKKKRSTKKVLAAPQPSTSGSTSIRVYPPEN